MNRLIVFVLGVCAVGCAGSSPACEYAPNMVDSGAYEAFAPNPLMPDGKTLRAPAAGTIARGQTLFHYGPEPGEALRAGEELHNPVESTPEALARGERAFQIFCSPCHGLSGLGNGPIVGAFSTPPSLLADRVRAFPDGRIFHVITMGRGLMASHGSQVTPEDRWKIVHHIRALQAAGAKGAVQ